ncbi:hypothetical protein QBC39DRAFT_138916 [Podospora conica]|nr:hypothetical protein QBC39DRAFT_138916 [Schizothecium conicum]
MSFHDSAAKPINLDDGEDHYRTSLKKDLEDALEHFEERSIPLIRNALKLWLQHRREGIHSNEEPAQLFHPLHHHYEALGEKDCLSEETVVGEDRVLIDCLKRLTAELPFEIYFASLTQEAEGRLPAREESSRDLDQDSPDDDHGYSNGYKYSREDPAHDSDEECGPDCSCNLDCHQDSDQDPGQDEDDDWRSLVSVECSSKESRVFAMDGSNIVFPSDVNLGEEWYHPIFDRMVESDPVGSKRCS